MKINIQFLVLIISFLSFVAVSATNEGDGKGMMKDDAGAVMKKSKKMGKKKRKKTSKQDCVVIDVLRSMSGVIKSLSNEIQGLKVAISEKCPTFSSDSATNETEYADSVENLDESLESLNDTETDDMTEMEGENMDEEEDEESNLPPIPTNCPGIFQPIAGGCYYFFYYPSDWKSWGEANAHCQRERGSLGTPVRPQQLREYLKENFSNVFWVGAKANGSNFEWINGSPMSDEEWKDGQPKQPASKVCVYWESFSGYKAVNHYCGEKFPYVCEYSEKME